MLNDIFSTWKDEPLPPKLHFSSPKEGEKDRKHADYINAEAFINFIEKCIPLGLDLDIMLEAKQKDLALYMLAHDIKTLKPEWKWIDKSTFEIKSAKDIDSFNTELKEYTESQERFETNW